MSLSVKLGVWQRQMLYKMMRMKKGSLHSLMALSGKSSRYNQSYKNSLLTAIKKHNSGSIKDSPIKQGYIILLGNYGPKNGYGFLVAPKAFL